MILPNAEGKIWLVGGAVSKVLCEELYGTKTDEFDFDFICEKLKKKIIILKGWGVQYTKYGNPTFMKESISVDFWPISDQYWIKENHLEPTIENFFVGVPFTIQAMAYDIKYRKVIGEIGIKALLDREIKVNNLAAAQKLVQRKGITINERMRSTAKNVGFRFISI